MRNSRRVAAVWSLAIWLLAFWLLAAVTLGGCASPTDHLAAGRWAAACRAIGAGPEGNRVGGWMWAHDALRLTGRAWTAADVARELGVRPYEYGNRSVLMELELALTDHGAQAIVAQAIVGDSRDSLVASSLAQVHELTEVALGAREPPPAKPKLPPGPHADVAAARPNFLSTYVAPLVAALVDTMLLPAELALALPSSGEIHPYMLFEKVGDGPTAGDMFSDALLDDAEWKALAKERAEAYLLAVATHKRESVARARAVQTFEALSLSTRRCRAVAGEPGQRCTLLGIVTRREPSGEAWLVVDVDLELGDDADCFVGRRFVARFPDGDLVAGAAAAIATLQPEAR